MKRCGVRYGSRREHVCRRPHGHDGWHARQLAVHDLRRVVQDCVNVCACTEYEPEDGTCACGHPWTGHEFYLIPEGCCVTRIPCDCRITTPEEPTP